MEFDKNCIKVHKFDMQFNHSVLRRVTVLQRLIIPLRSLRLSAVRAEPHKTSSSDTKVTIGDVSKLVKPAKNPQYVPRKYLPGNLSQELLQHLRWMLQKDLLGQDMFLIGRPGPLRRHLAMQYLEMTSREVEYVSLSRDTTEADLKQRREIKSGTASYFDQSAVRAAVEGRVLILEGIEKAERNVLPVLNNLLENREMHLEDGRFLIPASRYDKLIQEHSQEELDSWNLVRVSEDFRVIALGLPVPRYVGNPLDPPLRSRFQARDVNGMSFKDLLEQLHAVAPESNPAEVSRLVSCCYSLLSQESANLGLPDFPSDNLHAAVKLLGSFPGLHPHDVLYRLYPYKSFLGREGQQAVEDVLTTFQLLDNPPRPPTVIRVKEVTLSPQKTAQITLSSNGQPATVQVLCGEVQQGATSHHTFVETPYQTQLLGELLQSHLAGDLCLIGPRGCGKSATVRRLAATLNYQMEPVVLYQDMTSRDLVQQRRTLPNGDTVWQHSPLVMAALEGKMAILDGIHRIHPSTLAVIHRLVHDRELQLHDGSRLIRYDRYEDMKTRHQLTDEQLQKSGLWRIHPAFRIVALAEPPVQGGSTGQWLSSEILSLFLFHEMRPLGLEEELHIIQQLYGRVDKSLKSVVHLVHSLRESSDPTLLSLAASLSTRQLLRVARRMASYPTDNPAATLDRACLARFLPALARQALDTAVTSAGINTSVATSSPGDLRCEVVGEEVRIGSTTAPRYKTNDKTKIPDILFFDVPQHVAALEWLLQDFMLGEHLLLVGNQGVGKNKLVDRLLQLLGRPRQYLQLHRDTTVQTLTLQPTVKGGVVVYEDSPLVQAVKRGHVLVVDEADKAPTHVTCILKTLVEEGEMILSDGRRIVPHHDHRALTQSPLIVPIHPDFRMIVLANRPGFPFLGNDFFGALGDFFSCHAVDNPSPESERALLKHYGPDVPDALVTRLVRAFGELRSMADQGQMQYPYSTREVVNIIKHLQEFPGESLAGVVRNVFDFDHYSPEVLETLIQTLHKHGIPVGASASNVNLAKEFVLPAPQLAGKWAVDHTQPPEKLVWDHRSLKSKSSVALRRYQHLLDRVEARGAMFTEMQSHWSLPLHETGVIAGLTVSKGLEKKPLQDKIHVLTANPLGLFTMVPSEDKMQELSLQGLVQPLRGSRPNYSFAPVGSGPHLLLHEETSNSLILIDTLAGTATPVPLLSTIESATENFVRTLNIGSQPNMWRLITELLPDNIAVVYEVGGSKIEAVDLQTLTVMSVAAPCTIESLYIAASDKWLLQDINNKKFVLSRGSSSELLPSSLQPLQDSCDTLGMIVGCDHDSAPPGVLEKALGQKLDAPNRIVIPRFATAGLVVGFPHLSHSGNEVYVWPREDSTSQRGSSAIILRDSGQVVRVVGPTNAPKGAIPLDDKSRPNVSGFLEVTDISQHVQRYIPVPQAQAISSAASWIYSSLQVPLFLAATSDDGLVTVDAGGSVRLWETGLLHLQRSLDDWIKMIGAENKHLQMTVDRHSGLDVSGPKHGKVDEKGDPHVGGNTWAGGSGGRDTAGLGGKGGPYRLDGGHTVHQLSQEEKDAIPEDVRKAAREMGLKAFKQRLREIQMSEYDAQLYEQFYNAVIKQVQAVRVVLGNLQAKAKERQWLKHQTSGELDDNKLIEGLTGERTIFRRRAEQEPEMGAPQVKPKRLCLIVDVSGSMYRFNGYDGRLDREMEAVVLVMEAFQGHEARIQYDIMGHSGETHDLVFVQHTQPPTDNKQRLNIIKTMHAHAQFCLSGDHTLKATQHGISSLGREDCDEAIVIVLSDANLERYGIPPEKFALALTSDPKVNAYAIFIGSLGDQATRLTSKLPPGRAFVCLDLKNIPQILQQIFAASVLNTTGR